MLLRIQVAWKKAESTEGEAEVGLRGTARPVVTVKRGYGMIL